MAHRIAYLTALAAFAGILATATAGYANQASGIGKQGVFERFDSNRDGQITREEARNSVKARFARMDANGDGTVTRAERKALRKARRFERMDLNGRNAKRHAATRATSLHSA